MCGREQHGDVRAVEGPREARRLGGVVGHDVDLDAEVLLDVEQGAHDAAADDGPAEVEAQPRGLLLGADLRRPRSGRGV